MNIVNGPGRECGGALISHPGLDKVSFTGSANAGKHIMQQCAQFLRPVSLELGGKGAILVFDDADLKSAVDWIMVGIFLCSGQVCSATSRLLLHDSIADEVLSRLVEETKKIKMGDPNDSSVNMGPMISDAQASQVKEYLSHALKDDRCNVIVGSDQSKAEAMDGYYVEPIIVDNVPVESALWSEEIFGPFLAVRRFSTEAEAIKLTNDSPYGLGNAALTTDPQRASRLSRAIRSGSVWINCNNAVPVSMPFGGFKASGFGREMGQEGLDDYLHSKSVIQAKKHGFSWNWYC
jgi:betaine-aldehyde dehydrogenase